MTAATCTCSGYFLDPRTTALAAFLAASARGARRPRGGHRRSPRRAWRANRSRGAARRARAGRAGRSIGRPQVARALIEPGTWPTPATRSIAFSAAAVPASCPAPGSVSEGVIAIIHDAGGLASLAHPGHSRIDDRIPCACAAGPRRARGLPFGPRRRRSCYHYVGARRPLGLLMTGGSDFHGDPRTASARLRHAAARNGSVSATHGRAMPGERPRRAARGHQGLSRAAAARISRLELHVGDSIALLGFDQAMAEVLVDLFTGAIAPDAGDVIVMGRSTASINHADDWVETLDQFGLVSERAVLLDQLTAEQNLAMPLSLALDQLPDDVRTRVKHLAHEVGLSGRRAAAGRCTTSPLMRLRVRLGRALALDPRVLLAEHPNASLSPARRSRLRIRPLTRRRRPTHCAARHHRRPDLCARRR